MNCSKCRITHYDEDNCGCKCHDNQGIGKTESNHDQSCSELCTLIMLSEKDLKILLHDFKTAHFFYKHKDYGQYLELKSKIELLEWIINN